MFNHFPTNDVWNLSVDPATEMGAGAGEIEQMCAPLRKAARQPYAAGTSTSRETWSNMADKLHRLAEEDAVHGRLISAGDNYGRAATCHLTAERLQARGAELLGAAQARYRYVQPRNKTDRRELRAGQGMHCIVKRTISSFKEIA